MLWAMPTQTVSPDDVARWLELTKSLDIAPGPGGSRITDYTATRSLFESEVRRAFPQGEIHQIMVVALYPSAQIVGHKDPPIKGTRYHIPLQTNAGCFCFQGGEWFHLPIGQVRAMNPAEFHGAVNWGHDIRLHLAVDVE